MKPTTLDKIDEGDMFFAYCDTEDGKDLRSYFKGNAVRLAADYFHCECTTGDTWHSRKFPYNQKVWA